MFDFENNQTVEDLSTVPEEYRGLYQEGENGYTISDNVKSLVNDYVSTNKSLVQERSAKSKANEEAKNRRLMLGELESLAQEYGMEIGDEGLPKAFRTLVEDLGKKAKNGESLKVDLDKVKESMNRQHQEALDARDKEIQARDKALEQILIGQTATAGLAEAKGSIDLLLPHIERMSKVVQEGENPDGSPKYVVRIMDADGEFRLDGKGGFMGVKDLIEEMRNSEKFARAFESEEKGGTGTPPSGHRPGPRPSRGNDDMSPNEKISQGLKRSSRPSFGAGT